MSPIATADLRSPPAEASRFQGKVNDQARLAELALLAETDRHVRSHEQAHLAAAGQYARGGPSYQYQTGSDGKQYAIGGEVSIDTSPIPGDPAATAQKARVVQAAANAPADPSTQDRQVAAQAARMEQQAILEIQRNRSGGSPAYGSHPEPGQIFSIVG
jgi:SprA family protein